MFFKEMIQKPMLRIILMIFITLVFVISAFSAVHQISKLREARVLNTQLNEKLAWILKEKEKLQEELNQTEKELVNLRLSLEEKERAIKQMGNAQLLRKSLIDARERIQQLNQSLNQIKLEKTALEDSNLDMSNRLKNSTQELIRVIEDLKLSQNQLKDIEKTQVLPLKERIEELNKFKEEKSQELSRLEEELVRLEELESVLASKEERIKWLEAYTKLLSWLGPVTNHGRMLQRLPWKQQERV